MFGLSAATGLAEPVPRPAHGAAPWPAPANPLQLARAAGLTPERKETLIHHVHSFIHTESASSVPNRLGQFFTEWGVALSRTCAGGYCHLTRRHVYVNGKASPVIHGASS
jgi:hypothetical protein